MGKMRDLYEVSGKAAVVKHQLEEMGADNEVKQDTIESIIGTVNKDDVKGLANWLHHLNAREDYLANSIKQMHAERKHTQAIASSVKNCLLEFMSVSEMKNMTFDDSPIRIHFSAGRESVSIPDENKLAVDYFNTKTVHTPDRKRILEDLKNGKEVLGAELVRKPTINLK